MANIVKAPPFIRYFGQLIDRHIDRQSICLIEFPNQWVPRVQLISLLFALTINKTDRTK